MKIPDIKIATRKSWNGEKRKKLKFPRKISVPLIQVSHLRCTPKRSPIFEPVWWCFWPTCKLQVCLRFDAERGGQSFIDPAQAVRPTEVKLKQVFSVFFSFRKRRFFWVREKWLVSFFLVWVWVDLKDKKVKICPSLALPSTLQFNS